MWDEIVSLSRTKVIREIKIDDLANEIKQLEKNKKIKTELYSNSKEYKEKIEKHITNLQKYSDIRCQRNSRDLLESFKEFIKL